ncbi:MAG: hypothetical protein AAGU75_22915 [Bacillota bacterium]
MKKRTYCAAKKDMESKTAVCKKAGIQEKKEVKKTEKDKSAAYGQGLPQVPAFLFQQLLWIEIT